MARLRFSLGTWSYGFRINGKGSATGFLVVEDDYSVSVKSLMKTTPLFSFDQVKEAIQNGKDFRITLDDGTLIELRAKADDLETLGRMMNQRPRKEAA